MINQPMNTSTKENPRTASALVILGMHRSGTSALAGTLGHLGGIMPEEMVAAGDDNQTGFWEPASIVKANNELLGELGLLDHIPMQDLGSTADIIKLLGSSKNVNQWIDRLCDCVIQEYQHDDQLPSNLPMIIKDPRMCRLMPIWIRVFEKLNITPTVAIALRHPSEVARSLNARNGLGNGRALWLWMDHMLRAEHDSRGFDRVVISYDGLLANWRKPMSNANAALQLGLDIKQGAPAVDQFLNAMHRHHTADASLDQSLPELVRDAFSLFSQASTTNQELDTQAFDQIADEFGQVRQFSAGWITDAEHRCTNAYTENIKAHKHAQNLEQQLNDSTLQARQLAQSSEITDATNQTIQQELRNTNHSLNTRIQHLDTKLINQAKEFGNQLGKELGKQSESLRQAQESNTNYEQLIDTMSAEQSKALEHAHQLELDLTEASAHIQAQQDASNALQKTIAASNEAAQESQENLETIRAQFDTSQSILTQQLRAIDRRLIPAWRVPMKIAKSVLTLPVRNRRRQAEDIQLVTESSLFDAQWYCQRYPDVAQAGIDPALHYVGQGRTEGREPSPLFDAAFYLDTHRDVAAAGINPLVHYLRTGWLEGRAIQSTHQQPTPPAKPSPQVVQPKPVSIELIKHPSSSFPLVAIDKAQRAKTTAVAFYLPQFHPIPENDQWWGQGFTEWRNVTRAKPQFDGHDQPMRPGDLGYYDLRLPEVRQRQAELAQAHGIGAFCYHYYWFNGRRVLERPLNDVLSSKDTTMPFCICWANENWTRRWDGLEQEVLLHQNHTLESDRRFFLDLIPTLEDERYLRVDGKPVIVIYRADLMANAQDSAAVWRDEAKRAGLGDIHLCAVRFRTDDPRPLGFDAAIEFPPHHFPAPEITQRVPGLDPNFEGRVLDWAAGAAELIRNPLTADYRLYRCVNPGWDNTARRMNAATIYAGATPERYESWLRSAINHRQPDDGINDNLVFINAWNEWAEGAVLEPTETCGKAMLKATARAMGIEPSTQIEIKQAPPAHKPSPSTEPTAAPSVAVPVLTDRLKRYVRRNQTLNTLACRQPKLAQSVLKMIETVQPSPKSIAETVQNIPSVQSAPISWRGLTPDPSSTLAGAVFVSHDAARAGSQLLLLEIVRHIAERAEYEPTVILLGGGELEADFCKVARCITVTDEIAKFGSHDAALQAIVESLAQSSPAFAICASAVSSAAAQALANQSIPVLTLINELVTSMEAAYGPEHVLNAVNASQRCVCVSNFSRNAMIEAFDLDQEKVSVVYPGFLPHHCTQTNDTKAIAKFRAKHGIPTDAKLVLGCGTVHPRKGPDLFIRLAAKHLARQGTTNTWFVWIGAGEPVDMRWARHDVESAQIQDRCLFVGQLPEVGSAFEASDVFALTSREDPFPLVGLEALSRGVPMLCFDGAGGAPEIVEDDAGAVVPYLDIEAMETALNELLNNNAAYQSASTAARTKANERNHFDYYMDQILELVDAMTNKPAEPARL